MNITKRNGWAQIVLATVLLLSVSGCVSKSEQDGAYSFGYEWWVPLFVLIGGLAAVPAGWMLRERSKRLSWGLMALGPIAALFMAPSLLLERTHVTPDGFQIRSGIWGLTATHALNFDDISQIRLTSETRSTRRGKRKNYYLICDKKAGEASKVSVNNDVTEAAAPAILAFAQLRGIPFHDETGGQ